MRARREGEGREGGCYRRDDVRLKQTRKKEAEHERRDISSKNIDVSTCRHQTRCTQVDTLLLLLCRLLLIIIIIIVIIIFVIMLMLIEMAEKLQQHIRNPKPKQGAKLNPKPQNLNLNYRT